MKYIPMIHTNQTAILSIADDLKVFENKINAMQKSIVNLQNDIRRLSETNEVI